MSSVSRLTSAFIAALLLFTACGGSTTTVGQSEVTETGDSTASTGNDTAQESTPAPAAPAAPAASQASGTLTLSTGEVFELSVGQCETQATDPNDLLNDDFVDISSDTADGYRFTVLNARSAESPPAKAQVGLRSERPENGGNPAVEYNSIGSADDPSLVPLMVNGTQVTGEALLDGKFSSTTPFGDTVTATFAFNCG